MKQSISLKSYFLLAVASCLFLGCSKEPKVPPLVPVSGTVFEDNHTLNGGHVTLIAEAGGGNGFLSAGEIDQSGNYTIYTGGKPGAPVGRYKVTVNPSMMPMTDMAAPKKKAPPGPPGATYNAKFTNANTTTLTLNVTESPAQGAYNLKVTK